MSQRGRGTGRGGGGRGGPGGGPGGRPPPPKGDPYLMGQPVPPPDKAVTTLEDVAAKNAGDAPAGVSIGDLNLTPRLPPRKQYGTVGKPIILRANYFSMSVAANVKLCRYDVAIKQDEKTKRKKKRLMMMLLDQPAIKAKPAATDFSSILVTAGKLDFGPSDSKTFELVYHEAHEPPFPLSTQGEAEALAAARNRKKKTIEVKFLRSYNVQELISAISSPNLGARYHDQGDIVQVLNIVTNSVASTLANVTQVGGNVFYPHQDPLKVDMNLGQGLQALRGYFSSVRLSTKRILLNVNVSHSVFYPPVKLPDLMKAFAGTQRNAKLEAFLKRVRVETKYRWDRDNNQAIKKDKKGKKIRLVKQFTIFKLAREGGRIGLNSREVYVDWEDDNKVKQKGTVEDFFLKKYDIRLQQPLESVVNVGNDQNKAYIPAELCAVLPGQPARRMLSPDQTTQMLRFAARDPKQNAISITTDGLSLIGAKGAHLQQLAKFGVTVDENMITVHGRILSAPTLMYASEMPRPPFADTQASWNLAGKAFRTGAQISNWGVMILGEPNKRTLNPRGNKDPEETFNILLTQFRKHGVRISPTGPQNVPIPPCGPNTERFRPDLDRALDDAFTGFQAKGIRMLLVLLPRKDNYLYSRIKYYGDVKYGIATIAMNGETFDLRDQMTFGNVALKFNLKAGGVNHTVSASQLAPLDKDTMVVGIDVTHPSPGSAESAPSIAGVVASYDILLNQWPASVRVQASRKEMVSDLAKMIVERLRVFQLKNGKRLPTKILVYRDGVSEGQYQTVLETEFQSMLEAFKGVYPANATRPKVTIIVVGKRHHTRFYPTNKDDVQGKPANPRPGTIVDRGITGSGEKQWDFFLQAHQGIQGTARPAHYVVLKNEMGLNADQVERITHNLSYVYGRATKAVSVCPPAYYADLVCERGRAYLYSTMQENNEGSDAASTTSSAEWTGSVHRNLENTMFYI